MKKIYTLGVLSALLIGCSTANNLTKINSSVEGLIYNSVASDYLPGLTSALLLDFDEGYQAVTYTTETYKTNQFGQREKVNITIPSYAVDDHLIMLNKFLSWDQKAKERGDQFSKEIGRVKTVNGYSIYTFHSGNKHSNLLNVCFTNPESMPCNIDSITFDVKNVKLIIQDLNKFKSGGFKQLDTSIYN
ncbi:TPA: hypothetical protein ACPDJG_000596 [Pasteurella multocida]|nr:hypothetical protein [Pasteurella multocida]